jgi:PST family polysaccharide transporter
MLKSSTDMTRMNDSDPVWLRFLPEIIHKRIKGRTQLHSIIHNIWWLLGDKALRLGMGLIVGAWVARYLGPSQYGELSYVVAYVAFFQVISQLGLDEIAIRDMARDKQKSPAIIGTIFGLRLIAGVICWICAIGAIVILRPGDYNTLILTAIIAGGIIFQAADTIDLWFQSQIQSKRTVVSKAMSYFMTSILKVVLIIAKAGLIFFAVVGLVEIALSFAALMYSYKKFSAPEKLFWDRCLVRQLLMESWPYMLSGLAIIIYMRIDQIMLREIMGTAELGYFSAAITLSSIWYFIPVMISQSVGPSIAKKRSNDSDGYDRSINNLFSLMWWIMLPLSIVIALISSPVITTLYGKAYSESAVVLSVHVFANIPVGLGVMQGLWIVNENKNTLSLTKTAAGAISNVLLNLLLIPRYGAVGAATATVVSQSISSVFSNIFIAPDIFRRQILCAVWSYK